MMHNNIILIGPLATGKSTIAAKLSEITGLLNFPIDKLKWYYRFKNGYNLQTSTDILVNKGFEELIVYVEAFFGTNELKSILNEFEGIIDLGATDSYCHNLKRMRELKSFFHDFPNIFLIMPAIMQSLLKLIPYLNNNFHRHFVRKCFPKDRKYYYRPPVG